MPKHVFHKLKCLPWLVCRFCGLISLKNDRTAEAVRKGCDGQG